MAVYKIFPYKDTTIYSESETSNTGLDAILEVKNQSGVARSIVQFSQDDILDVINNKIGSSQWDVNLKCFIAEVSGLSTDSTIEIFPLAQEWDNGTGEYGDLPITTDGASWINATPTPISWSMSGSFLTELFTGSFDASQTEEGGGNWFFSGSNLVTQSFDLRSKKDINVSTLNIVDKWYSGSLPNNGFILKLDNSREFNTNPAYQPIFKFFSVDTNTIYPPILEFKWDDYNTILTGSESNILNEPNIKVSLSENAGEFYLNSKNRFRINSSPTYPVRTFQTSSYFTNLNYLPTSSYYAIKDLDTNEYVVDFDDTYTKISADEKGNYFDVYMDGLQPERYYKIQIKSIIGGSVKIFDDQYLFKIIN